MHLWSVISYFKLINYIRNEVKIKISGGTEYVCKGCQVLDELCVECSGHECTKCTMDGKSTSKEITVISSTKLCTCPLG